MVTDARFLNSQDQPREVAIAILYHPWQQGQAGQFLMQLRDDIPGIVYPGYWGLFGGHIEPGETPETAVERELIEEIGYAPPLLTKFSYHSSPGVIRHVFQGELTVDIQSLVLSEGWDLGLLTPEDIRRGSHYSPKADQVRPLGVAHQEILLDFIQKGG
ncbi:MAG: NUDIX hydrolase [Leptolyngbyaceae bacterium]|nr:NUDIX hydrolase [Leptolyngbyaceae bacterium]